MGMRIKVFWSTDKQFYCGKIVDYCESTGQHHILYDDGDNEELKLDEELWFASTDDDIPTVNINFNSSLLSSTMMSRITDLFESIEAHIKQEPVIDDKFKASRQKEILVLLEKGVLEPFPS